MNPGTLGPFMANAKYIDNIANAIWMVESGGALVAPPGDKGLALGPLQIHRGAWLDSRIPGTHADVNDIAIAKRVFRSYIRRYKARTPEEISKLWNAGPGWRTKTGTAAANAEAYWQKVRRILEGTTPK